MAAQSAWADRPGFGVTPDGETRIKLIHAVETIAKKRLDLVPITPAIARLDASDRAPTHSRTSSTSVGVLGKLGFTRAGKGSETGSIRIAIRRP